VTVYVAEIKGRGVAAFQAEGTNDAERVVSDRIFRDDLLNLASEGLPLWDGVTGISVRGARPEEAARWRSSRARAVQCGDIEETDATWVAYLVALTDPSRRGR
jgi:hypothetical protein